MTAYGRPGVYISEHLLPAPIAVTGTANAAGACIGKFGQGPETVTLVTSWYDFVKKFGGYNAAYPATFGVGSFFQNGGSELYVRRVLSTDVSTVAATVDIAPATGDVVVGTITAKNRGDDGNLIRVQFNKTSRSGYYNLVVYKEGGVSATDSSSSNDVVVESYNDILLNDAASSDFVETVVGMYSQYITIVIADPTTDPVPTASRLPLTNGANGPAPTSADYSAVIDDFSAVDRPLVLFVPEINVELDPADAADVIDDLISWAEGNNGFVVVDTEAALAADGTPNLSVDSALVYADARSGHSPSAVYYPNIYISDPLGRSSSALRKIGPAGAVAGLYLFTDKATGPFKAPAGQRANIRGAVAVEKQFTSGELDQLNSGAQSGGTVGAPINAIRNLPGAGVVAYGARTLLQDGTANRYVNTRRSLIYLKKSLNDLTQFALFENNDDKLWARLRASISVFLTSYQNQGGLRGTTPGQAFYVKVDAENNPDASIQQGEVHIEVGVALQYPAEFVVINLSQKTSA
jgi:phage tail sheath protein FI